MTIFQSIVESYRFDLDLTEDDKLGERRLDYPFDMEPTETDCRCNIGDAPYEVKTEAAKRKVIGMPKTDEFDETFAEFEELPDELDLWPDEADEVVVDIDTAIDDVVDSPDFDRLFELAYAPPENLEYSLITPVVDDDFDLRLEGIRNINYLSSLLDGGLLDEDSVRLSNDVFCSLFVIGDDNRDLPLASSMDIAFIEMTMDCPDIVFDRENLINLLDLAVTRRVTPELNEELEKRCLAAHDS